jgi:tetratricopeptide (TPR) repeat protein
VSNRYLTRRAILRWGAIVAVVAAGAVIAFWFARRDSNPAQRPPDPAVIAVVQQAQKLYDSGRVDDGIAMVRGQIATSPEAPYIHYTLGVFLLAKNDFDTARSEFETEIALNPGYAGSHTQLGLVYSRMGDQDRAVASFEQALRLKPDDPDATFYLGRSLSQAGRYADAETYLAAAARTGKAPALSELGLVQRRIGRSADAIQTFERALAADPWDLVARLNLGQLLVATGHPEDGELVIKRHAAMSVEYDAFDRYRRGALLEGAASGNLVNLGRAQLRREEYDQALTSFQRAVDIDPRNPDATTGIAEALLAKGRAEEVDPWIGRSLLADPSNARARFVLALAQLQRGDADAGLQTMARAQASGALEAGMFARAADALRIAGKLPEAIAAGREAVRRDARDPSGYRALGLTMIANQDAAGALAVLRKGIVAVPDDADLRLSAGIAYLQLGDRDAAQKEIGEALRVNRLTIFGDERVSRALAPYRAVRGGDEALDIYRQLKATG